MYGCQIRSQCIITPKQGRLHGRSHLVSSWSTFTKKSEGKIFGTDQGGFNKGTANPGKNNTKSNTKCNQNLSLLAAIARAHVKSKQASKNPSHATAPSQSTSCCSTSWTLPTIASEIPRKRETKLVRRGDTQSTGLLDRGGDIVKKGAATCCGHNQPATPPTRHAALPCRRQEGWNVHTFPLCWRWFLAPTV